MSGIQTGEQALQSSTQLYYVSARKTNASTEIQNVGLTHFIPRLPNTSYLTDTLVNELINVRTRKVYIMFPSRTLKNNRRIFVKWQQICFASGVSGWRLVLKNLDFFVILLLTSPLTIVIVKELIIIMLISQNIASTKSRGHAPKCRDVRQQRSSRHGLVNSGY